MADKHYWETYMDLPSQHMLDYEYFGDDVKAEIAKKSEAGLRHVNEAFNTEWNAWRRAKAEKEANRVPGPGTGVALCAGENCKRKVKIIRDEDGYHLPGSRLCIPCQDFLRGGGKMTHVALAPAS